MKTMSSNDSPPSDPKDESGTSGITGVEDSPSKSSPTTKKSFGSSQQQDALFAEVPLVSPTSSPCVKQIFGSIKQPDPSVSFFIGGSASSAPLPPPPVSQSTFSFGNSTPESNTFVAFSSSAPISPPQEFGFGSTPQSYGFSEGPTPLPPQQQQSPFAPPPFEGTTAFGAPPMPPGMFGGFCAPPPYQTQYPPTMGGDGPNFGAPPAFPRHDAYYPRRIHTPDWDTKPPCAVIVTIYSSGSYDDLFRAVQQQSPDPESSIALFEMDLSTIDTFLKYFIHHGDLPLSENNDQQQTQIDAIKQVFDAIEQVQPNSVVFNFECCGACSDSGFNCHTSLASGKPVVPFVKRLLDKGYMVMFGDFSLKALINDWDATILGPNPFDRVGACNSSMNLAFDSQQLLACPSGQLQNVGKLNDGISKAELHCLGGTIVCTLKDENIYHTGSPSDLYDLEVLTIATAIDRMAVYTPPPTASTDPFSEAANGTTTSPPAFGGYGFGFVPPRRDTPFRLLEIGEYKGYLGHAILKYRESGGVLLVSTGHWIELSRLDAASEERVLQAVRSQFGGEYSRQLDEELTAYGDNEEARRVVIQRSVTQLVQSSAPCSYSQRSYY